MSESVGTATRSDVLTASAFVSPFRESRTLTALVVAIIGLVPLGGYKMTFQLQLVKLAPALLISARTIGIGRERLRPRFNLVYVLILVIAGLAVSGATATLSRGGLLTLGMVWALARRLVSVKVIGMGRDRAAGDGCRSGYCRCTLPRPRISTRVLYRRPQHRISFTSMTHNMHIEVASGIGLIAFFVFVGCLVCALFVLIRPYPPDRNVALEVQGSRVALATFSIFLSEEYYIPLWIGASAAAGLDLGRRTRRTR